MNGSVSSFSKEKKRIKHRLQRNGNCGHSSSSTELRRSFETFEYVRFLLDPFDLPEVTSQREHCRKKGIREWIHKLFDRSGDIPSQPIDLRLSCVIQRRIKYWAIVSSAACQRTLCVSLCIVLCRFVRFTAVNFIDARLGRFFLSSSKHVTNG